MGGPSSRAGADREPSASVAPSTCPRPQKSGRSEVPQSLVTSNDGMLEKQPRQLQTHCPLGHAECIERQGISSASLSARQKQARYRISVAAPQSIAFLKHCKQGRIYSWTLLEDLFIPTGLPPNGCPFASSMRSVATSLPQGASGKSATFSFLVAP